jgi:glycosyltransferase involved in cell wall biosynthesis
MRLTIGYDATAALRQTAGIGRYTRQLLAALARRDDDLRYRVFACSGGPTPGHLTKLDERFRYRSVPLSDRVMNAVWHRAHLPLPVQLITGPFDLFHSPDFTLPPTLGKPTVLTVHDLAFLRIPDAAYPTLRRYLQRVVPASVSSATRVIAVSEATRRDLVELLGTREEKVTTVLEGVGPEFRPAIDHGSAWQSLGKYGLSGPYVLSVGTLEPRKNYTRLLQAFEQLRGRGVCHRLVIAGRRGWLYEPILRAVSESGENAGVQLVEPEDGDLPALYSLADIFIYPSLYEGFGLPPLEAMACGTAVACSSSSSLPEVVGDAGVLFDPFDIDDMAAAVDRLLRDDDLRRQLAARGRERAASFTWERAAEQTVRLYQEVAASA